MWIEARDDEGKLLFRYDPARRLIEIRRRQKTTTTDLQQLESAVSATDRAGSPARTGGAPHDRRDA